MSMILLDLSKLRPGDVILEGGDASVARATGGDFGHAAIAVGRLVRLEAVGKHTNVQFAPFDFQAFSDGTRRIVGPVYSDGVVRVRRMNGADAGKITGEAIWEAGRNYSIRKAEALPDLTRAGRRLLKSAIDLSPPADDVEGRFCSEVVARVLGFRDSSISPNELATRPELVDVPEALRPLDERIWKRMPLDGARTAVERYLAGITLGRAASLMEAANTAVQATPEESDDRIRRAADEIEATTAEALTKDITQLRAIEALEESILAAESTWISSTAADSYKST